MQEFLSSADFLALATAYPLAYQLAAVAVLLSAAWVFHLLLRRLIVSLIDRFVRRYILRCSSALRRAAPSENLDLGNFSTPKFVVLMMGATSLGI